MALIQLANPTRFLSISGRILPWMWGATLLLTVAGLYYAFPGSPGAATNVGETVRLMYVHVPADWLALLTYGLMAVAALGTLIWRHPLADVTQKAAAPIGAAFTFLGLVTGMLWGQPTWGTFWVWEARLVSFLLLLIVYLGLMVTWRTVEDPGRAGRVVSVLTLVGLPLLVIIHYSVDWWNSLHQGAGILSGSTDEAFLTPLFLMLGSYSFLFVSLLLTRMRTEIFGRRLRTMQMSAARAEA
ncbi:MAG: heme ABC transporter permease CcmC [Alphaproteobacteria bacterium]